MSIVITVWYKCKPGLRPACEEIAKKNVIETRKEEGNIYYNHYPSMENDDEMFVIEVWENIEAVQRHISMPHYLDFSAKRKPMLVEGSYRYVVYEGDAIERGDGIATWSDQVNVEKLK